MLGRSTRPRLYFRTDLPTTTDTMNAQLEHARILRAFANAIATEYQVPEILTAEADGDKISAEIQPTGQARLIWSSATIEIEGGGYETRGFYGASVRISYNHHDGASNEIRLNFMILSEMRRGLHEYRSHVTYQQFTAIQQAACAEMEKRNK